MPSSATSPSAGHAGSPLLTASSVLCIIGALAFASVVVLEPDATDRDAFASPTGIAGSMLAGLGLTLAIIHLANRPVSPDRWAHRVTISALAFTLSAAWFSGTAIVAIGDHSTDAQFENIGSSAWTMLFLAPKMILGSVGLIGWALTARRAGHLRRSSTAALIVAGIASLLPPFAPGVLFLGIALGLLAHQTPPMTDQDDRGIPATPAKP